MKRIFAVTGILLAVGLFFTGFSPSVDGRAVVAAKGDLPEGLFGKTVGYLPGDSVTVINPANGNSVDILVLGSLDPSEGVAILLSSEAADELKIEKDANNLVKLTKRTGKLDEQVYGSATIAKGPEPVEKSAETLSDAAVEDAAVEENSVLPSVESEIVPVESIAAGSAAIASSDKDDGGNGDEETAIEYPEENYSETENNDDISDAASGANDEQAFENQLAEEKIEEEVIPEPIADEAAVAETVVVSDEPEVTVVDEAAGSEDVPAEEIADAAENSVPGEVETEKVAEEKINPVPVEDNASELVEGESGVAEVENTEEQPAEEIAEAEDSQNSYAPIVLVPAVENPPVSKAESEDNAIQLEVKEAEVSPVENSVIAESAEASDFTSNSIESYIIPSLKDLQRGKYYVQISVLKDKKNIENLIDGYKTNYPFALVPSVGGSSYQVMVGPLEKDEYGSVMQKFKEKGFKDCFLRKIK